MRKFLVLCITTLLMSSVVFAYPVKCNKDQTICQVESKRLVQGDLVGIFDEYGYLIAIGKVRPIKSQAREVTITKTYEPILRSHKLAKISDQEASQPGKYFKYRKAASAKAIGLAVGLTSIGVGERFYAINLGGYYQQKYRDRLFIIGRGFFLNGNGKATSTKESQDEKTLSLQVIAALGGVAYNVLQLDNMTFRMEGTLGVGNVSASVSGGGEVKEVVDGQVFPGMGFIIKGEADVVFHFSTYNPYVGFGFLRLQNSTNYDLLAGVVTAL